MMVYAWRHYKATNVIVKTVTLEFTVKVRMTEVRKNHDNCVSTFFKRNLRGLKKLGLQAGLQAMTWRCAILVQCSTKLAMKPIAIYPEKNEMMLALLSTN